MSRTITESYEGDHEHREGHRYGLHLLREPDLHDSFAAAISTTFTLVISLINCSQPLNGRSFVRAPRGSALLAG
jgi:hypothetical protein